MTTYESGSIVGRRVIFFFRPDLSRRNRRIARSHPPPRRGDRVRVKMKSNCCGNKIKIFFHYICYVHRSMTTSASSGKGRASVLKFIVVAVL